MMSLALVQRTGCAQGLFARHLMLLHSSVAPRSAAEMRVVYDYGKTVAVGFLPAGRVAALQLN